MTAYLSRPEGDAPRTALVLMHGCSGLLNAKGKLRSMYRAWTSALVVHGYAVLAVDSASPRGFGQTFSPGDERVTMWHDRPKNASAALQTLQYQPFGQPSCVA